MIDWQALGLVAQRTLWFMLVYFAVIIALVSWQKYRKHSTDLHPWAVPFTFFWPILYVLVISGAVVL